jgi:hypothetical protein
MNAVREVLRRHELTGGRSRREGADPSEPEAASVRRRGEET